MAEPLARAEELFFAALERPPVERADLLRAASGGDEALCAEVLRLLAAHERAASFLETPVAAAGAPPAEDEVATAGRQLGAYRLVREIGRGGMGAVYLAERADAEYRRRVAVKLIKRGLDSDAVERRFRRERQILASLDHPNVARLLDGGSTEDGTLFFVMEYIEGEPIDAYCDRRRLSIDARLALFAQVCAAVSYAHQRLVIHRDLKPSNVLVGADGTPKLLDFGIAKLLHADTEEDPLHTATGLRLLTPQYASPEQVLGQRVTTASDVYSLGVVLYELLTGRRPYHLPSRALPDVVHAVTTTEIERPSDAVRRPAGHDSTGQDGATRDATDPSTTREGSLERLRRRLRGDLDNILLRALRREPERRYASVEQFAEDLRRHARGLPVLARPDTLGYRLSKFARRNRVVVGAAALLALTLVAGLVATGWQARRALAAQQRAERRFDDVRALARSVLFDYHDAIQDLPGATPVRHRLVRDALAYLDRLASESEREASLERELAAAYERMSAVQGGNHKANLGDTAGAIASQRKALALRDALLERTPRGVTERRELAVTLRALGQLEREAGETATSTAHVQRSLVVFEELAAEDPSSGGLRLELARGHDAVGTMLEEQGDLAAALEHQRQAQAALAALPETERTSEAARRADSVATEHLALVLLQLGDHEEALRTNERALRLRAGLAEEFPLNIDHQRTLSISHYNQGQIEEKLGRTEAALRSYQQGLALNESLAAQDPVNKQFRSDLAFALVRVADQLVIRGDPGNALVHYRRSRALRAEDVAADPVNLFARASLIEVTTRICTVLAAAVDAVRARAECDAARVQLEAVPIQPTDVYLRNFQADAWAQVGAAYRALAARALPAEAPVLRASARRAFEESRDILRDFEQRGTLPAEATGRADALERTIAELDR